MVTALFPERALAQLSGDRAPLSPDFINFGYLQNNAVLPYLQYDALSHIAPPFVDFLGTGDLYNPGTFTNRSSYLRPGGAAERAGTKVIVCVRNRSFSEAILDDVMQDPVRRNRLKNQVISLVTSDPYCAGVNFDFEFVWGASTRDGITAFIQEMRAALPQEYELSVYTHAIYNSTRWDIPAITDHIDYMLYSTYDWGSGNTPHANADFNNCLPHIASYLDAGLPPHKMVLTWAAYGRRWYNTPAYDSVAIDHPVSGEPRGKQSQGFYNGLYDTTLRQRDGGPFVQNYVTGDEIGWHTYTENNRLYTSVTETPESIEMKVAAALNFPGDNFGRHAGVRLGGVGWWSLMWVSNYFHPITGSGNFFDSWNPVTNSITDRPPYYRHIDLLVQEILKAPGQTQFSLESFENYNPHWRDPNESPDTSGDTDGDSNFQHLSAPAGAGRPHATVRAGRLYFDFENASNNKVFLRHEMINDVVETHITDTNAALALVSANTRFSGHYYVSGNYSQRSLRLALVDGQRQVEVSTPIPLPSTSGWNSFTWDINDAAQIQGWNTSEPALLNGNGVVNTAGPDARDISFLGFIVEGGGAGSGSIYFDELTYESRAPEGKNYLINEFHYRNPSGEFVEIAGPPGLFPADMQLVTYRSWDGEQAMTINLGGHSIPASGYFVIKDPSVSTDAGSGSIVPAGWGITSNLTASGPGSLQLYGSSSGHVYDSVVYQAFGGLEELPRIQTRRVTGEGYGWIGAMGSGASVDGTLYSLGRSPDNTDTNVNQQDFSFMPSTPGATNGAADLFGTVLDFSTPPPSLFQTYQAPRLVTPPPAIPASPGGGNVYRCVDTSGGGVIGVFGDGTMGSERGLDVTGKLYIPAAGHPTQAVAVGIGARQGSTFFAPDPTSSGYEDGYWLIYENGTVNLNDGQPNHPGQFQFIMASNGNQAPQQSLAMGSNKSLGQLGAAAGTWVNFHLRLDPTAPAGEQLIAQVNGIDVYRGDLPEGGNTHGAFATGHRETGGGVSDVEGTWVDDILINHANPPARIDNFELY